MHRLLKDALVKLLGSPLISHRKDGYSSNTTVRFEQTQLLGQGPSDAAVVRVKGTDKGLAVKTDCNGRYVYLNPRKGGQIAVAEAARNVVCAGGKPSGHNKLFEFRKSIQA